MLWTFGILRIYLAFRCIPSSQIERRTFSSYLVNRPILGMIKAVGCRSWRKAYLGLRCCGTHQLHEKIRKNCISFSHYLVHTSTRWWLRWKCLYDSNLIINYWCGVWRQFLVFFYIKESKIVAPALTLYNYSLKCIEHVRNRIGSKIFWT